MIDRFPEDLKAQLQAAILAALERERVDLEAGATATVSNQEFGVAEIPLTDGL